MFFSNAQPKARAQYQNHVESGEAYSDSQQRRRRRRRSSPSSLSTGKRIWLLFVGLSTGKRIWLLFVGLNVFAVLGLNFFVMNQTLQVTMIQKDESAESRRHNIDLKKNMEAWSAGVRRQILPLKMNTSSSSTAAAAQQHRSSIAADTAPDILINTTKIQDTRSQHKLQLVAVVDDKSTDTRKWAYAFLLGGARSSNNGTEYLGGLYSVVAAAYHLRKLGSRADIVLMVQIAADSPHEKLPELEEEILQKMNIKVVYIPKFANASMECFYSRKYL